MRALVSRLLGRGRAAIENASPGDAAAFADIHAASFGRGWSEAEFERLLTEGNVVADRASCNGRAIGFVLSRLAQDEAEILSVAVAKASRGGGVGRRLIARHLQRLTRLGVRAVFLEVEDGNTAAQRLYRGQGFTTVGRRSSYYRREAGESADALVLRRDLT